MYPNTTDRPTSGSAFGSQLVAGTFETKADQTDQLAAETVAAVIVFQTWLGHPGHDPAALIQTDKGGLVSMDHAWYFTGPRWQDDQLDGEPALQPCLALTGSNSSRFRQREVFAATLEQLASFSEPAIARAFASIPSDWGADRAFRARLAQHALKRRERVEEILSVLWKGP